MARLRAIVRCRKGVLTQRLPDAVVCVGRLHADRQNRSVMPPENSSWFEYCVSPTT